MKIYVNKLAHSVDSGGIHIATFEIQLPKVLLAELNTHRVISKNFQSSRAVPTKTLNQVESFYPLFWGENQTGMVAKTTEILRVEEASNIWNKAVITSKEMADELSNLGLHKQWSNRLNDWHVMAKGVITATNWDNFLWLRNDEEAQPEFQELARLIQLYFDESKPQLLQRGEWHLPYIQTERNRSGKLIYVDSNGQDLTLEDAQKISASCCGQVSYRRLNDSKEKALEIYAKLFSGRKPHLSPTEHQATPIGADTNYPARFYWPAGITHMKRNGLLCSGNLDGWIQYRQTLTNNVFVK